MADLPDEERDELRRLRAEVAELRARVRPKGGRQVPRWVLATVLVVLSATSCPRVAGYAARLLAVKMT